jgi:hypothetical protein
MGLQTSSIDKQYEFFQGGTTVPDCAETYGATAMGAAKSTFRGVMMALGGPADCGQDLGRPIGGTQRDGCRHAACFRYLTAEPG